jgi:hypothetical protein
MAYLEQLEHRDNGRETLCSKLESWLYRSREWFSRQGGSVALPFVPDKEEPER